MISEEFLITMLLHKDKKYYVTEQESYLLLLTVFFLGLRKNLSKFWLLEIIFLSKGL